MPTHAEITFPAIKKGILFCSLYLAQTVPKGYLKFLPIIMAENGDSMKAISYLALLSFTDLFKPLFGAIFDTKNLSTTSCRKAIIVSIELAVISLFLVSMMTEIPNRNHLVTLFACSNILTSIHDTAVDGLAVNFLKPSEQPAGAFGQYAGYKFGNLIMGGILPAMIGANHKHLCRGVILIMTIVLCFTLSFDVSTITANDSFNQGASFSSSTTGLSVRFESDNIESTSEFTPYIIHSTSSSSIRLIYDHFINSAGVSLLLLLLLYKLADHGLDFIWGPLLVQSKISRRDIVKTQFVIGNIAAVLGALMGTTLCRMMGSIPQALQICSVLRIIPGFMQLTFTNDKKYQTVAFVAIHAVLENFIGSAVTGAMFSYLLQSSSKELPATSYAIMNTIVSFGMNIGEFSFGQLSYYYNFAVAVQVGIAVNLLFPLILGFTEFLKRNKKAA